MSNSKPLHSIPRQGEPLLSPLRYPGSKRRLVSYINETLELNGLSPKAYIEPFAGGASVALQLLSNRRVEMVGLADIDPLVIGFWRCVFFDTNWLIDTIEKIVVDLPNWEKFRKHHPTTERERALKCLFLNRTSFSGIIASSVGPIGGKSQTSDYQIDCRFPKATIIKRINQISAFRERIEFISLCDWRESFRNIKTLESKYGKNRVFMYLDPPFFHKAKRLYNFSFTQSEHVTFHNSVVGLNCKWLLSYDAANEIQNLYTSNGTRPKRIEVIYSVSGSAQRKTAKELIITNLIALPKNYRIIELRK